MFLPFSRELQVQKEFEDYLQNNPNKRHISIERKLDLVRWLIDPEARPRHQSDYSLRNYAQKTYEWDRFEHILWGSSKNGIGKDRIVATEDEILETVEKVHLANDHKGWDATWDEVSNQYCGIVRDDVIFLLKRCHICQLNPRKRAKKNQALAKAPASEEQSTAQQAVSEPQAFEQLGSENVEGQHEPDQPLDYGIDFGDSFLFGSSEDVGVLWDEGIPAIGLPDIDIPDYLDPALYSEIQGLVDNYSPSEEASGSNTSSYEYEEEMQYST
ncbi:hypothetical protein ACHAQJ_005872 [Trichoderma viride]